MYMISKNLIVCLSRAGSQGNDVKFVLGMLRQWEQQNSEGEGRDFVSAFENLRGVCSDQRCGASYIGEWASEEDAPGRLQGDRSMTIKAYSLRPKILVILEILRQINKKVKWPCLPLYIIIFATN